MYAPDERIKELYRSDSIEKYMTAEFYRTGEEVPFITIYDSTRFLDMTMEESLSSSENLDFGSCEATQIKLKMSGFPGEIKGREMLLYQTLDGTYPATDLYPGETYPSGYTMPLGRCIVQSAERQVGTDYWEITALDFMAKFDVDVIAWYNALPFPLPLREFRARLCRHIGVAEHVPDYLPNDSMLVEKTIEAATLMGRDALIACEQANGVFGHFNRVGVLQHITLQPNYSLLPALELFPSDDLCPVMPGEMNDQVYDEKIDTYLCISGWVEDYTVRSVEKVQVRQEEGDIGAIYGTGENCLTVEGNFLAFGKSAVELEEIARGIFGMAGGRMYIPYECSLKGLPYMEVGDSERFEFGDQSIVSYVVKRTLKGISALKDTHSATGEEIRSEEHNINTEIIQLKGKTAILKRNVDEVSAELTDFEKETSAKFAITAEQISAEVKRAQEAEASLKIMADNITLSVKDLRDDMEAQLEITAEQISMKVSKGEVSSQLTIEPDAVAFKTNRLSWLSDKSTMTDKGKLTCQELHAINGYFSGQLVTDIFDATDDEIMIGDWLVSADNTNVFQSGDGSVVFQTAQGGPFGRYSTLILESSSGTTELSDHHLDVNQIDANGIEVRDDIYFRDSWTEGMSLLEMLRDLYNRVG